MVEVAEVNRWLSHQLIDEEMIHGLEAFNT